MTRKFLAYAPRAKQIRHISQDPPIACDVSDDESVAECFARVAKAHDRVDVLINNAGISTPGHPSDPPTAIKRAELLKVMDVNVGGVVALTQAFLPLLKKSGGGGVVVNVGSSMGSVELTTAGDSFTGTESEKILLYIKVPKTFFG